MWRRIINKQDIVVSIILIAKTVDGKLIPRSADIIVTRGSQSNSNKFQDKGESYRKGSTDKLSRNHVYLILTFKDQMFDLLPFLS